MIRNHGWVHETQPPDLGRLEFIVVVLAAVLIVSIVLDKVRRM